MAVNWNILAQPQPEATPFNPLAAIQAHRQGVADYRVDRKDNALLAAGKSMAAGDSKGAQSALYGAGEFDAGFKIQEHQLKQAQHEMDTWQRIGKLAENATPEQWGQTLAMYRRMGINLPAEYLDPTKGQQLAKSHAYDKAALLQQGLIQAQTQLARAHAGLFQAQAATAGQKENPYQIEAQKQRAKDDEEWRTAKITGIEGANEFIQHAEALRGLVKQGGVGPVAGSVVGRVWDMTPLGDKDRAALRGTIDSRLSQLELALAKAEMKGQGTITDKEREILTRMIATVRERPETLDAVMGDLSTRMKGFIGRAQKDIQSGRSAQAQMPAQVQPPQSSAPLSPVPGLTTAPMPPVTTPPQTPAAQQKTTAQPVQIRSAADYEALPPGSVYVDPNGNVRRKP